MSDLVEFLLARIAEDEDEARDEERAELVLRYANVDWAARVLAECEAKRRIVTDRGFLDIHGILSIFGARILGYMAEPYRDHPDYDEAWRP